jgi:aminopeptidase N
MPKPFAAAGTPSRFTPDRPFRVTQIRLELDLDLAGKRLAGAATLHLQARQDGLAAVSLDAVEMHIVSVAVNGHPTSTFSYDGEVLRVELPAPMARGASAAVTVQYDCRPRRGLHFLGPDADHPDRPLQCWTQGQDDDSRHYFPCVDRPIEKAPTEVIATVPAPSFVLSNGELVSRDVLPDGRLRWHYRLDFPHPPYLVSLVCGPFAEWHVTAPETGVEVHAFVPPARRDDAERTFGRTPAMIDFFSRRIGVPYPHRRYSQIAVPDFIFGGMENTSATTLTELVLLDARAALDHDMDGLISHELAHQWWGDLLTCREWSEAWLNEGFATYFEYVWREHAKGRDEADVELLADTEAYFNEAARYERPIVCREYDEPIHLFDGHLYDKGGRVLHMLRHLLGEDGFWASLRHYAITHARTAVDTRDLSRAIEDVTGRNLDPFFDRWVARAGHPELECAWEWNHERSAGRLRVKQKQTVSDERPAFRLEVPVRFEVEGVLQDRVLSISESSQVFDFPLAARPTQVIFDPGDVVLKLLTFDKPAALWRHELGQAALGIDRICAARALGKAPDPDGVRALGEALASDAFWAVRAAAARALGRTRREDALTHLEGARTQPHPRVRRAVAAALGEFRSQPRAAAILSEWASHPEPSVFVEAERAAALGRARVPDAVTRLLPWLGRDAFQDVLRTRAIEGLGATGDARAIEVLREHWRTGASFSARRAMVAALGELGRGTARARGVREFLEDHFGDPDFRVRAEIGAQLARLGDREAIPALERALAAELDGRAKRRMRDALAELREGTGPAEQLARLHEEMDRFRRDTAQLRERLDTLESARPTGGEPGSGGARGPHGGRKSASEEPTTPASKKRPRTVNRRAPRDRPVTPIRRR